MTEGTAVVGRPASRGRRPEGAGHALWRAGSLVGACVVAVATLVSCSSTSLGPPPAVITIGTLYASTGQFAGSSQAEYQGLQFWKNTVNEQGGIFVKMYNRKIPVTIKSYDDKSQSSLALTEYQQLISEDHVDLLVSDFGTILTSVAVPIAQENQVLLFDPTATTPQFFTESIYGNTNPFLVLTSLPSSAVWPNYLGQFLLSENIKNVAIIQDANAFDAAQVATVEGVLAQQGVTPVATVVVPTYTTDYSSAVSQVQAANPDAVLEFGYGSNDVPFLQTLAKANVHFKMTFDIFPGENLPNYIQKVPPSALSGIFTYYAPPLLSVNHVTLGMTTSEFVRAFAQANPSAPPVNFLGIAGYQAGLIMQDTVANSPSLNSNAMKATLQSLSGHVVTLEGTFTLDANGSQTGILQPIAQVVPNGAGSFTAVPVYPPAQATASAQYPAPLWSPPTSTSASSPTSSPGYGQ